MNQFLQEKYKYLFITLIALTALTFGIWGYKLYDNSNKEIKGIQEGRQVVFNDEYLDIFDFEKRTILEEKKPQDFFGIPVVKKWQNIYTKDNLKNGFEAWWIMDKVESNDQAIAKYVKLIGIPQPTNTPIIGCNDSSYTKLTDNNVLPVNYYMTIKANRIFLIKHFDQLKQNTYTLNLNNFCLKN
jgi:hypothetical protein